MKLQSRFSLIGIFSLALGLITFIPHVEKAAAADPGVTCVGTSCTVTFDSTGSVQTFTPAAVGQVLSITVAGGAGGKGGNDAGGPGGAGSNGATFTFNYTTTSLNPLYIYVGSAGTGASGCVTNSGGAAAGVNPWTGQYSGGRGGNAGGTGCSGAGGGGGAATVIALSDKADVLAVAGGGAGGTGANISSNGAAGAGTGATVAGTNGAAGANFSGDGGGGGGGGGGVAGGQASSGGGDGSGGGTSARAGTSVSPVANTTITYNNNTNGYVSITYPRGPEASTLPSFTDSSKAFVGQVFVPNAGTWTSFTGGTPTLTKRVWQVSNDGIVFTDISPAVSGNYTTTANDLGKYFRYAVTASDSNGVSFATSPSSLQVTGLPVFTAENPTGTAANTTVNTNFAGYTFVATGFRITYSISAGSLPAGITLNPSTGALTGRPTQTGLFKYKVLATNDSGTDETAELTLIVAGAPVFTSDDSTLQSVNRVSNPFRVGTALPNFTYAVTGYPAPTMELVADATNLPTCGTFPACAYSYETLGLPPGVTFNPTTGLLSGTPTKAGAYAFAIKATNSAGSAFDYVHMTIAARAPQALALSSDKNSVTIVQGTTVTATITATGGDGTGAYSFAVDPASSSICSVAQATATTATMTVIAAGNCVIVGTKAAQGGVASSRATITIPVNKAPQTTAITATSDANPAIFNTTAVWVRGAGGNGTGAFSWTVADSSSSFCSVNFLSGNNMYMNITGAGSCLLNVTKAGDAFFLPQSTTLLVTIDKANQPTLSIGNPGTVNWNATTTPRVTLNTSGGAGTGAVTYTLDPASTDFCTLVGNVLTAKSAGSCVVTATKAADTNWKSAVSAPVTWTINQINQTALTVTAATVPGVNIANGSTFNPYVANPAAIAVLTVAGGLGTGSIGYSSAGGSNCQVAGAGTTGYVYVAATGPGVGWCTITVTKAADINFLETTATFQFHIGQGSQTPLVATVDKPAQDYVATTISNPASAAKAQITLTGGLGTGAVTYSTTTTAICSVDANGLITSKTAGTCQVNITKAADTNYTAQTTTATAVFNKLNQAELVSEPAVTNKDFVWSPKATIDINSTGGAGTGAVTYAVDPSTSTVCSVNASSGLITSLTAGRCVVNVTKAGDTNYNAITDTVTVTFNKVNPAPITLTSTSPTITYTTAATKNTARVTVSGGIYSTGAFTFFIDPFTEENCSITTSTSNTVTVAGNIVGICLVTVVQASDVNYFEQRAQIGIQVVKMTQTIGATSSVGLNVPFKDSPNVATTINVTGQAGTGLTRYALDPANTSGCAVDQATGNVTSTTVGTCRITVSRDGDDNVLASNSVVLNLSFNKVNQAAITLTPVADFKLAPVGSPASTSVLGIGITATGTGNFTRIVSATPAVCTITGGGESTTTPATFTPTLSPNITVTAVDDGTCTLTYSKLGDTNYNPVVNATASFIIGKATQADLTASITTGSATMPYVATPKATATITATGGSGTGTISYSVDPASSTVCSVNASGVVTNINAGVCNILVKRNGDTNFTDSATRTVTITFTKIDQSALTVNAGKLALRATTSALDTTTLSTTGGLGTGAVTYSIDTAGQAFCSISGTTVTGIGAGECTITATKAGDVNYNPTSATVKLTVTKGTQAALAVSPYWNPSVAFVPQTAADSSLVNAFVWSGGSGTGELAFSIDPSSAQVCNRAGMRPGVPSHIQVFALGSGTCTISVYRLGGAAWENSNTVTSSFTITKIAQSALTATPSRTSVPFNNAPAATFTVTTTGGSGDGANSVSIAQASASICADATGANGVLTIRTLGVGNCVFNIVKAMSAGYNAVTSNQVTVTITKGTQAQLVATATPSELTFSPNPRATTVVSVTGGQGTGAVTITVDSGSTAICSYSDATKTITALQSGRCELTVTKAGDTNFNAATTKLRVTINKMNQAKLNLTAANPNLRFSEDPRVTTTLSVSGGTGTGAVTYAVAPGSASVCSLSFVNNVPTITGNYYGYCDVTATKAGDVNYADATATTTIRIAQPGTSIVASIPNPTEEFVPAPGAVTTVTVDGSKDGDLLTYTVDDASKTVCSAAGNGATAKVTSLKPGLCNILVINVSKASDGTLIASSSTVALTIIKAKQPSVEAKSANDVVYFAVPTATNTITVTGGITGTPVTAAVDPESTANCSVTVTGNVITMRALLVGSCKINFMKAGNANFEDFSSSITVPILKSRQAAFSASASPSTLVYAADPQPKSTITATGGSGTGAVTYAVAEASATICSLAANVVTALTGGSCEIIVTKAGDENFSPITAKVTINIAKANQQSLKLTLGESTIKFDPTQDQSTTIAVEGGSGAGEVTYSVQASSSAICQIVDDTVVALRPGDCVVVATKASDPFYNAANATATLVITKADQAPLQARVAPGQLQTPFWNSTNTTQLIVTGGSGFGAIQLTNLTTDICSATLVGARVNVTGLKQGTCSLRLVRDTDYAYLASTPLVQDVTVSSAPTNLTATINTIGNAVAGGRGALELTIRNLGPAKADGAAIQYQLPTGITVPSPLPTGCSLVSSSEIRCATTRIMDSGSTVVFTVPINLAANLTGGQLTLGGVATVSSVTPELVAEDNNLTLDKANFIVNSAPVKFERLSLNAMQTGKQFSDTLLAIGFPTARYTVTEGDLPAGLQLNEQTGEITGIPTGVGAYSFRVSAYNSAGSTSQLFTGTIAPAPLVTVPATGFGTNTLPAGTRVTITGVNLNLINSAIIGGVSVKIVTKTATQLVLEVPNATQAGTVNISLVYAEGTLAGGTFTYTGAAKRTPVIVVNAGNQAAGAGETPRTLTASITAEGVDGQVNIPVTYSSRTTSVCTVTGTQLTFLAAGTCTVVAASAANAAFNAATSAPVSLTVTKSSQSLVIVQPKDTVPPTPTTDSADGFDLEVSTTSGLTPVFVSATPTICDVTEDGHVTGLALGKCVVNITQPGDAKFAAIAPTQMEFTITADSGQPTVDNGDPLRPTSLAGGSLTKMGDVGFTWNKKLAALSVETYGIWIGRINAVSEFTVDGKSYRCNVDFGILKAMASKTPAQRKLAMARKVFKATAPFCNAKTEAQAFAALKKGFAGLQVKVTITRFRMYPTTYKPINAITKKPITTQIRTVYLTLG